MSWWGSRTSKATFFMELNNAKLSGNMKIYSLQEIQAVLNRKGDQGPHKLFPENNEIKTANSIKLLGINIDN